MKWGSKGKGDGQFEGIAAIAVDALGSVYSAEYNNQRIQKFDSNGRFIARLGD
jgi:hypothetical protein